jgi:hypothetical protein
VGLQTTAPISPFINRYVARCTDLDVATHSQEVLAYAKMGRLLLFGFLVPRDRVRHEWEGLKVNLNAGTLGALEMRVPAKLRDYLSARADHASASLTSISRQRGKRDEITSGRPDEVASSEAFRAFLYDHELSGQAAFEPEQAEQPAQPASKTEDPTER